MNKRDKENNNKKERDWNEREENEKRIKTVVDLNYAAIKVPPTKARMEIERRGFFADSFFFSIFPRSIRSSKRIYRNLARLKCRREKEHEGSQPKLIGIRERGLTWSFSWKKLGELGWQKLFRTRHYRAGEPLLRETDISPRGARNFRVGEKSVSSLAKFSWERCKRDRSLRFPRLFRNLVEWHTGYGPFFRFFRFSFIRVDFESGSDAFRKRAKKEWIVVTWNTESKFI